MAEVTRLAIVGGAGRMGQALAAGLDALAQFSVDVLVDTNEPAVRGHARHVTALAEVADTEIDVVVDFSHPDSVVVSADWCAKAGVGLVIGTTGLSPEQRTVVEQAGEKTGVIMASNFSIGAVLSERFAAMAAPYFDRVEIIELHHDRKVDAPSGTSLTAADGIRAARVAAGRVTPPEPTERFTIDGARGADAGDGIRIHSVRLPGLVAHQEILFGGPGEGLTIRHDSFDRTSFTQGVALAAREVVGRTGFVFGIDEFVA